eukprot:538194-Pleurochrysis_carterae.AAC.2
MASRSETRLVATVRERAQVRGLGAPTGLALVKGTQRAATAMREYPELGERSASKLGKYACQL